MLDSNYVVMEIGMCFLMLLIFYKVFFFIRSDFFGVNFGGVEVNKR